MNKSLTSTHWT